MVLYSHLENRGEMPVRYLASIGHSQHYLNQAKQPSVERMEQAYEETMKACPASLVSLVMASVVVTQTDAIALLEKKGFQRVGVPTRNPNSGNTIVLYVKFVKKD